MILASGDVGIGVLMKHCQNILDGKGMPADWATSVAIHIFKGKGDIMNCGMHLLEHAMKIVVEVLDNRLRKVVTIYDIQFGSMPGKGKIDAVFILRRERDEYLAKQMKLYMCFVDLENAFEKVPRNVVEWAMRKNCISSALVGTVVSLYKSARTKVRVGTQLSEEF